MNNEMIYIQTMTSLELSELSGKEHKNVKRDIENILSNVGIDILKFEHVVKNHKNQDVAIYRLPKAETLLVTSKWNDKLRWKIIQELERQTENLTPAEQLLWNAQRLVDQEREQARLTKRQLELEESQNEIKAQVTALVEGDGYFTAMAGCRLQGIPADDKVANRVGRRASKICRQKGLYIGTAPHPRYGTQNTYPKEIVEQAINELFH